MNAPGCPAALAYAEYWRAAKAYNALPKDDEGSPEYAAFDDARTKLIATEAKSPAGVLGKLKFMWEESFDQEGRFVLDQGRDPDHWRWSILKDLSALAGVNLPAAGVMPEGWR